VVDGRIPACRWIRLACERQLADLRRKRWKYRFDRSRANLPCAFVERLVHVKGRWKNPKIKLEDWQCFFVTTLFGWIDKSGYRRFRKGFLVVPRGNAKTTIAAGLGLFLLLADGEPGAEVYSAATTRDQAKIAWGDARTMVCRLPDIQSHYGVEPHAHAIYVPKTGGTFRPLSADAGTLEGLAPSGWICDELHAHTDREVFDVLNDATGKRRQALGVIISTEGGDDEGVFATELAYCREVLDGVHQDDSIFVLNYTLDAGDDWTLRSSWIKANPNFGVSVSDIDMEIACRQAKANAARQPSFLSKRLNVRVGAAEGYFNMFAWRENADQATIEEFRGQRCIITVDLASKRDLTTVIALFKRDGKFYPFGKHYLPEEAIADGQPNQKLYQKWALENRLVITPGPVTDYEFVFADLEHFVKDFRVDYVGIDPNYNSNEFTRALAKRGIRTELIALNSTVQAAEPMKDLDRYIVDGVMRNPCDPVLTWCIGNTSARHDAKGNPFPIKTGKEKKIDAAVALIANVALWNRKMVSIYGERSIEVFG
jgi:phage terminase large subunit-like protein